MIHLYALGMNVMIWSATFYLIEFRHWSPWWICLALIMTHEVKTSRLK